MKNPKRMLASPDNAAVAVIRSRLTTVDISVVCSYLFFSNMTFSYCSGKIDTLARLHRYLWGQTVGHTCKCLRSLTVCLPGADVRKLTPISVFLDGDESTHVDGDYICHRGEGCEASADLCIEAGILDFLRLYCTRNHQHIGFTSSNN